MKQDVNDKLKQAGSKLYFDRVADNWDNMRQIFFSDSLREKAIRASGVQKGQMAADIGAGSGFISKGLLEAGLNVIAVDRSESMLAEMKSKFSGKPFIEYSIGDGEQLPIKDATIDRVFANMYLHHSERPAVAIREMARILKPGGKLVVSDLDSHNYEFLLAEQHDRWPGFQRADISDWMESAGLSTIKIDCADEDCCTDAECGGESASISIFIAIGEKP